MRVLVIGSSGFIGRAVASELESHEHDVYRASRDESTDERHLQLDLLDGDAVRAVIEAVRPDVVVNAAGIVENTESATQNVTFTQNIVNAIALAKPTFTAKLIICGSAAEYGYVEDAYKPVKETDATEPLSTYGKSKYEESLYALEQGQKLGIDVVIARIFNPIGTGMASKFLVSRILEQVAEIKKGERASIELTRLDSVRDYIDVRDIASAIRLLAENKTRHNIYNIGTGLAISNGELARTLLQLLLPGQVVELSETSDEPERPVASKADISRLKDEFNWMPKYTIEDTLREIANSYV